MNPSNGLPPVFHNPYRRDWCCLSCRALWFWRWSMTWQMWRTNTCSTSSIEFTSTATRTSGNWQVVMSSLGRWEERLQRDEGRWVWRKVCDKGTKANNFQLFALQSFNHLKHSQIINSPAVKQLSWFNSPSVLETTHHLPDLTWYLADRVEFDFRTCFCDLVLPLTQEASSVLKMVEESQVFNHQDSGCGLRLI